MWQCRSAIDLLSSISNVLIVPSLTRIFSMWTRNLRARKTKTGMFWINQCCCSLCKWSLNSVFGRQLDNYHNLTPDRAPNGMEKMKSVKVIHAVMLSQLASLASSWEANFMYLSDDFSWAMRLWMYPTRISSKRGPPDALSPIHVFPTLICKLLPLLPATWIKPCQWIL